MTQIIDGKAVAAELKDTIAEAVNVLAEDNIKPGLAVVLVGEDPASDVYVRNKGIATRKVGMESIEYRLPTETSVPSKSASSSDVNELSSRNSGGDAMSPVTLTGMSSNATD